MAKIKIRLDRGLAGKSKVEIANVHSLGLKKPGQIREHEDNSVIRGMIFRVSHLVSLVKE